VDTSDFSVVENLAESIVEFTESLVERLTAQHTLFCTKGTK
jgi:hypothetical protein